MQPPERSYIIWFSQRTGSTLLAAALHNTRLEGTRQGGVPGEHLNGQNPATFTLSDLHALWQSGTGGGGLFAMKYGPSRNMADWTEAFRRVLELPQHASAPEVWNTTFPNCRHVFVTRRNRVRLAVSWWRAIVSGEWHRALDSESPAPDIADRYDFAAIDHLFAESALREATIEDFFAAADAVPLTVVYEDFIRDYAGTVARVLDHLGLERPATLPPPAFGQMADALSEEWAQRFRSERQAGWDNPAW
ncbi:Stf0 family sulfotransferase [Deinococcus radiomollis]|uniref:Stf0 family sulfotransferase n=1 Tax=Deinococcus radiomollis TaxID=468916 RepID=UPI003892AC7C